MQIQFGSGVLFSKPVAGNEPTNPSPFRYGVLQEATVDFKGDLKKLFGQTQFAVATARGKLDVTLKAKLAVYDPNMINQLYFAQTYANNYQLISDSEPHTVNSTTNTATVTNTPIVTDWGVVDASTGQSFINVPNAASLTATSQYAVNITSGVYSFYGADGGRAVLISYLYSYTTTTGGTITLASQMMGYAPIIQAFLYNKFRGKYLAVQLNAVTLGSISIPTKLEDFWMTDIDGSADASIGGGVGTLMADLF